MRSSGARALYAAAAEWGSLNPVLNRGAFAYSDDTGEVRVGNGVSAWSDLPAIGSGGGGGGGWTLLDSGSVSSGSGVQLNTCFSTTYDTYELRYSLSNITANRSFYCRMVSSGVQDATSTYTFSKLVKTATPTMVSTTWLHGPDMKTSGDVHGRLRWFRPANSGEVTGLELEATSATDYMRNFGFVASSTGYDGFFFGTSAETWNATWKLYARTGP